jgi:hypothetical protein
MDTQALIKAFELNKFKRLIKIAIDNNKQQLKDDIIFAHGNLEQHTAHTILITQTIDDPTYGIAYAGKSIHYNDVYLFRYMYTDENLNYNLYHVEIKKSIVIKIKYIDNYFFPKELVEIRKLLSWDNKELVVMDLSAIICGHYGDKIMFDMGVGHGNKFHRTEGFLPGPNKNK